MSIALAVFDIAGTTVTDNGNINKAFHEAFSNAGYEVDPADIDKVMGYKKVDAIKIILLNYKLSEEIEKGLVEIIHNDFTDNMVKFYQNDDTLQPLPFAEDTFRILQDNNIKVALNTGFTRVITNAVLERLQWDTNPLINAAICSDEVPEGRPEPFMIHALMKQLNITSSSQVVKVGDTEVDIREGRNSGCAKVIAVTTGAFSEAMLEPFKPDHIIHSLQQLPALIL